LISFSEHQPRGAARKRFATAVAATALTACVCAGTAFAQAGGTGAPGAPAAPAVPVTPTTTAAYVFPIAGPHSYGQGFGAPRAGYSHGGQDIMAACGTPLVATSRSRVIWRKWQGAAGNYLVIKDLASKQSYAYMHMLAPAAVLPKQILVPGQQIGNVGRTGRASACHLHFEAWTKKGYYRGGRAFNPLNILLAWDPTA
jgi:murein DD-endopeptidase MepM/ murein hydrolase activator NlpD